MCHPESPKKVYANTLLRYLIYYRFAANINYDQYNKTIAIKLINCI